MNEFMHHFEHYVEVMADPAHLMAEATFISVELLFLAMIYQPIKKRRDKRAEARVASVVEARVAAEHAVIDAEHGVTHLEPGAHESGTPVAVGDECAPSPYSEWYVRAYQHKFGSLPPAPAVVFATHAPAPTLEGV